MHRNPIPLLVLAAALSSCSLQPEILNSQRIEQKFGNYGIDVLSHESGIRRSNLYSSDGSVRTCRTYAVVVFVDPTSTELATEHQAVMAGQSIGSTFQNAGWQIQKVNTYVGSLQIRELNHPIGDLMRLDSAEVLGLHAYRLVLLKGSVTVHYATIIETHHPDYLDELELRELYPIDADSALKPEAAESLLQLVLRRSPITG